MNESPVPGTTSPSLDVLVIGATGGSGRAAVHRLLADGHRVTAFSRHARSRLPERAGLECIDGNATSAADVERAVAGRDAVLVTLGISEDPFRVRVFGAARTSPDVRSRGTRNVVGAMRANGVGRLVVQSSYGVGETAGRIGLVDRLFFRLVLAPQIADTERQERIVRESGIDWVIVQPVHLTDDESAAEPFVSVTGETRAMKVSRASLARCLAAAASEPTWIGRSLAVSG